MCIRDSLKRITLYDGTICVGFYYGRLRNFIIATKVLKLHQLRNNHFQDVLKQLVDSTIGQETLLWYYNSSIVRHKHLINDFYQSNALIFANTYEGILNKHLPNIKDQFDPFTKNRIGLIISNLKNEGSISYAFYKMKSDSEKPLIVLENNKQLSFESLGINTEIKIIRSDRDTFLVNDPIKKAKKIVREQLSDVLKNGGLSELKSQNLLKEQILAIINVHKNDLQLDIQPTGRYLTNFKKPFDIQLDDITDRVYLKFAEQYFREEAIREMIKTGKIPVKKEGNYISYSIDYSKLDNNSIIKKARKEIESKRIFPSPNVIGNVPPYKALVEKTNYLKEYCSSITETITNPTKK